MLQKDMCRKMLKELREGTLIHTPIYGEKLPGGRMRDYFIIGFNGALCGYYHAFEVKGNTQEKSFKRLAKACGRLPLAEIAHPESVYQFVYDSESDIVAALIAGTNPAGDTFAVLAHHGAVPELIAKAIVSNLFTLFAHASGKSD